MNNSVMSIAADTFQDATWRKRVRVKMACDEVIQMKKRKMTVPCDSSKWNVQDSVRDQENQQGNKERRHESGRPGQAGQSLFVRLVLDVGKMRFLSRLMNDVAAIQEDRRLEEPVRDQMEHGQARRRRGRIP